jgi:thiosulfate/3-mercaptopyruvate sulfurtransferase
MNRAVSKLSPLVTTKWLHPRLPAKGAPAALRVLDASAFDGLDVKEEFAKRHIPTSQLFNIKECRDTNSDFPAMLPKPSVFEEYVGHLGVNNKTHVILYDHGGLGGIFSAPRVWWMLRYFGHDSVSVLNGGLARWIGDGYEVTEEINDVAPEIFKAQPRKELIKLYEDIVENVKSKKLPLVDARGPPKFKDHIKGAIRVTHDDLHTMDNEKMEFKSPERIKKLFQEKGISIEKPFIATCNSGVTACTLAFGAYLCGNENIPVYDGSWQEWHKRADESMIARLEGK